MKDESGPCSQRLREKEKDRREKGDTFIFSPKWQQVFIMLDVIWRVFTTDLFAAMLGLCR